MGRRVGTNGDLSCTARVQLNVSPCARVDEPGGTLPVCPAGRPHSCGGCCGLHPSLLLSPRGDQRGADANQNRSRNARTPPGGPVPGLRAGPFGRALRSGIWPATHPNSLHHKCGERYGFVLERLPSSGRTCCGAFRLRRRPSAGLSVPGGNSRQARRCPKLRKTCVLLVWMRSVDDWPLAKILTRFLGVSYGRYPSTNWSM